LAGLLPGTSTVGVEVEDRCADHAASVPTIVSTSEYRSGCFSNKDSNTIVGWLGVAPPLLYFAKLFGEPVSSSLSRFCVTFFVDVIASFAATVEARRRRPCPPSRPGSRCEHG
jgi:hypothetical protein